MAEPDPETFSQLHARYRREDAARDADAAAGRPETLDARIRRLVTRSAELVDRPPVPDLEPVAPRGHLSPETDEQAGRRIADEAEIEREIGPT